METVKEYTREDLTVVWKPETCSHSRKCFSGLRSVFDPTKRPWVDMSGAEKEAIINQVKQCPSGALSYRMANATENPSTPEPMTVEVNPTGPLIVKGDFTITHPDGRVEQRAGRTTLCRCGASQNKPFCDASHKKIGFAG